MILFVLEKVKVTSAKLVVKSATLLLSEVARGVPVGTDDSPKVPE